MGRRTVQNTVRHADPQRRHPAGRRCTTPRRACGSRPRSDASALVTSAGVYGENEVEWTPWLRTTVGIRGDGSRYDVDRQLDARTADVRPPASSARKATATFGPGARPSSTSTPAPASTATDALGTTHHVRRQRQSGRAGDASGAREGRRDRRAHRRRSAPADARSRSGRFGSARSWSTTATSARPSPGRQQAVRRRDRQLLQPEALADLRRRRLVVAGAFLRVQSRLASTCPRPSTSSYPAGASVDNFHRTFAQPAASLLRSARAGRGQLGAVEGHHAAERRGRVSAGARSCG